MSRIYCDTCVYRDLFEGRKDRFRDLADFALSVFRKVKEKQYKLVISDWVIDEFKKHCDVKVIEEFIKQFEKEDVIEIVRTKDDENEARRISSSNYPDALHVVLAKKGNAIRLVTQNIEDFAEFQNLIEIVRPESL